MLKGDNRSSYYNMSTHSYDYRSSLGDDSQPPDSSVVENLHALSINIERRHKELDMQAATLSERQAREKEMREHNETDTSIKHRASDASATRVSTWQHHDVSSDKHWEAGSGVHLRVEKALPLRLRRN